MRLTLPVTLLLGLLVTVSSPAQETEEETAPALPNFAELQENWWSYFEGTQAEVEPRIEDFFARLDEETPLLGAQNQETAQSVLEAVQDNLDVYLSLLGDTDLLEQLADHKESLFNLRFQFATGQLEDSAALKAVKKDIARVLTELRAREIADAEAMENANG